MTSELAIITTDISPGCGGVADHTLALLRHWKPISNLSLLVAKLGPAPPEAANVHQLGLTREAILKQLPRTGGKVFVQYSAYGFNRFGFPRDLIHALVEWRKRAGGHLVVMFHEIWGVWPFISKNFVLQQLHRRAVKHLIEACDAVFTTTASQADHLRHLAKRVPVQVLPAGSNIRLHQPLGAPRAGGCAVLFGLQSNRIRALETMRKSLAALADAGRFTRIVCIGQGSDPDASDRERELLGRLNLSKGFAQQGGLSEEEVSDVLSSASFGIFGQSKLSCTKSGSFMAYAAHQVSVLADFGESSKSPPGCWIVSPAELLGGIDQTELDRRAECLRMWHEQNCSWEVIAGKIGHALGVDAVASGNL